jgi:hypothetical protein
MALFRDRFGSNTFHGSSNLRQRDPTHHKPSSFLSLFDNANNPNDIDLAYLDSVIFQPIANLNSSNNQKTNNDSSAQAAGYPKPPTSAFPFMNDNNMSRYSFSSYPSRATDLERERNGL